MCLVRSIYHVVLVPLSIQLIISMLLLTGRSSAALLLLSCTLCSVQPSSPYASADHTSVLLV